MLKRLTISFALAISAVTAATGADTRVIDLRAAHALEDLQRTNPAHFAKIQQVIAALAEQPKLAEGNWLQVNVAAQNVELSRDLIRTSYPPKQVLQFTLEETRYVMNLVRNDLTPQVTLTKQMTPAGDGR